MRWLELFAGAGGVALGLRASGAKALACVEYDSSACDVLRLAGFPAIEADLRDWTWEGESPDAVWASFPCQCWSTAGNRQGAKDERNGWPWTVRIVNETRPEWLVCENVRGLTNHSADHCGDAEQCSGCYFHQVILVDLRERFEHVQWAVLDAADYGVPQHRRRVFIIAGPRPVRWPSATHGAPSTQVSMFGSLLPWNSCGEALGLESVIGGGRNPTSDPKDIRRLRELVSEPSTTIAAQFGGGAGNAGPFVARRIQDPSIPLPERPVELLNGKPSPTISANYAKGVTPDGNAAGGLPFMVAVPGALIPMSSPGPTMTSGGSHHYIGPGIPGGNWWEGRRRLTVAECAKLQDFPDGHPFQGTQAAQYRQVGNAVPPIMAELIAREIQR
tara:strand:+ start:4442 stop:5605 length:1164 start_codon:yes stop_codon:yes gene_type:complete